MNIITYNDLNKDSDFFQTIPFEEIGSVNEIIKQVRLNGDNALIELSKKFNDGNFKDASDFVVSKDEIKQAYNNVDPKIIESIKFAIKNVETFAKKQISCIKELHCNHFTTSIGHKIYPMESVLCYCPGGRYPLLSSCYMTIIPALVAGVKNIYLTSPKISNETIVSAHLSGATKIYKLGGAQAISAFAHGTDSIKPVDKIVGPGNKYVTAAKKAVFGKCDIDFLAGPSEVMIVSNDINSAKIIAADMLAQAEHDIDARSYLITNNIELANSVQKEAIEFLKTLNTKDVANSSFEKSICVIVDNIEQAIELANKKAPEHLELIGDDIEKYSNSFKNYGSLFIGKNCAEVFGDYCSGTNHVLPTNGCARFTGGLSVFDFIKIQTYQKLSKNYSKKLSHTASILAQAEGLYAHKLASDIRKTT